MNIGNNVKWAFSLNQKDILKILLSENPDEPYYWNYLDELFTFLKESACYNVPKKLQNINTINNFESCLAELEVAKLFIDIGKKVDIILNNDPTIKREPDLLVTDSDFVIYVEVTRITDSESLSRIANLIDKIILELNFPFVVDVKLNKQASSPFYLRGRKEKKDLILNGLNEFKEKIIKLGDIKIDSQIITQIGEFTFRKSFYKRGYPGKIESSVLILDGNPGEFVTLLKNQIIKKAEKRESWTESQKMYKFVVVLVFENPIYPLDLLNIAVFGNHFYYKYDGLIEKAKKHGWEDTLLKLELTPNRFLDPKKLGIFFTEKVTKNVNAVIGISQSKILFIPNPFCEEKINDPKFCKFMELTSNNH